MKQRLLFMLFIACNCVAMEKIDEHIAIYQKGLTADDVYSLNYVRKTYPKASIIVELSSKTAHVSTELAKKNPSNIVIAVDDDKKIVDYLCKTHRSTPYFTPLCDNLETYNIFKQGINRGADLVIWHHDVYATEEEKLGSIIANAAKNLDKGGIFDIYCQLETTSNDPLNAATSSALLDVKWTLFVALPSLMSGWSEKGPITPKDITEHLNDKGFVVRENSSKYTTLTFATEEEMACWLVLQLRRIKTFNRLSKENQKKFAAKAISYYLCENNDNLEYVMNIGHIVAQKK